VACEGRILEFGWQSDPELKHLHDSRLGLSCVPDTVSCAHPLDAPLWQDALLAGRFRETHPSLEHDGHGGDPPVRVPAQLHWRPWALVEHGEVEKHEWLDDLAEVRWTHEAGDGPASLSARAVRDFADGLLNDLTCQHDLFLHFYCCLILGFAWILTQPVRL